MADSYDDNQSNNPTQNRGPVDTIRDGRNKATIWEHEGKNGSYHTTSFAKTYEDKDGSLRDGQSFNTQDLLKVSELARSAYGRVRELEQERNQTRSHDQEQNRDDRRETFKAERSNGQQHDQNRNR